MFFDEIYQVPSILSGRGLVILFLVVIIIFHWLLVYPWPLDRIGWKPLQKRGWKIVDYVWLVAGSIALVGTTFTARQILSNHMLPALESDISKMNDTALAAVDPHMYMRPFM
jgi:hypothetical protein